MTSYLISSRLSLESLWQASAPGLLLGSELLWADDAVEVLFEAFAEAVASGWRVVYGAARRSSNATRSNQRRET